MCSDFTRALRPIMQWKVMLLRKYDNKVHCAAGVEQIELENISSLTIVFALSEWV